MDNQNEFKTIVIDDTVYTTLVTKNYERRKQYMPPNLKAITAYIPGTIREIFVKVGDRVKSGDKLLILEAMKMKNKVVAPFDGTIKILAVAEGQSVPKNHLLIEFE